MTILRITAPDGEVSERALDHEALVIGRAPQCDLALADSALSRTHARLFRVPGGWRVEDLGSSNGTFVNQRRITGPTQLAAGDVLAVGNSTMRVLDSQTAAEESGSSDELTAGRTIFRPARELLGEERQNELADEVARETPSSPALTRYAERLRVLLDVHRTLSAPLELGDLLPLILDRAFDHLRPEEGAIFLRTAEGGVELAAQRSVADRVPALRSRTLIRAVIDEGQAALVADAATDQRFRASESIIASGLKCLLAAPLLTPEGALGMIVLASRTAVRLFGEDDLELLASLAAVAGARIRALGLAAEAAERRRLEGELALAREIQVALIPSRLPEVGGLELHAHNRPSRVVSGDFHQMVVRSDGRGCTLLLADVSGKGIGAALLTASLEALMAAPLASDSPPAEICCQVSRLLFARTPANKYATALLAMIEPASGRLRYANAGHLPPLVLRRDGRRDRLDTSGPPLGLLPEASWSAGEALLEPGDLLVAYTDGITEAAGPSGSEYGGERLAEVAAAARLRPLPEVAAAIEDDLESFVAGTPFADDRTLVLVRRSD